LRKALLSSLYDNRVALTFHPGCMLGAY
jgi:hypothetical protein